MLEGKREIVRELPLLTKVAPLTATYQIVPDYNLSNKSNLSLVNDIASIYKPFKKRIKWKKKGIELNKQVVFDILLSKKNAEFFLSMDEELEGLLEGKMHTVWDKASISKVDKTALNTFQHEVQVGELILRDYTFKSLSINQQDLYPMTAILGVIKNLKEDEKIRVVTVIEPLARVDWISIVKDELDSLKKGRVVDNTISTNEKLVNMGINTLQAALDLYIDFRLTLIDSVFGIVNLHERESKKQDIRLRLEDIDILKDSFYIKERLSPETVYKQTSDAFKIKIIIVSESKTLERARMNMIALSNAYKTISHDNELILKELSTKQKEVILHELKHNAVTMNKKCILSDKEVAKLLNLPQKTLQQEYGISNIDTREVQLPVQLQAGQVRIGIAGYRGKEVTATFATDKNIMALPKVIVGPQNAGKTTMLKRIVKDYYNAGYSNIIIDFIEDCETAKEVSAVIPTKDKVIIRLGERDFIPALAFNEVSKRITEDMDQWEKVHLANLIAEQVEQLINTVTDSATGYLTAPMLRYLHAASMVTFIRPFATVQEVFQVLRDYKSRNEAIRYAKYSKCFAENDEIFSDLEELHKRDAQGKKIIGTREDLIIGITNRITILKKNPYMKAMLMAEIDQTQDFERYIREGKSIFIMIPQNRFPNEMIRDVLTTYFLSRLWVTVQLRKDNKNSRLCNVIFDEVAQVPTTARFLAEHITELRRHRLGILTTAHYLKQFKELLTAFKSAGSSYMLLAGTEKENLEILKEEIAPFTIEEGLKLKQHTTLNIINYGSEYAKFIARQPKT